MEEATHSVQQAPEPNHAQRRYAKFAKYAIKAAVRSEYAARKVGRSAGDQGGAMMPFVMTACRGGFYRKTNDDLRTS